MPFKQLNLNRGLIEDTICEYVGGKEMYYIEYNRTII